MPKGYVFDFQGKLFEPDGRVMDIHTPEQVQAHNASIEAAQLAQWAKQPEHFAVYIGKDDFVTTWLGTKLGRILHRSTFRGNIAHKITCVRFRGTNGAEYYGRYGSDWSQLCRVRKVKSKR